MQNSYNKKNVFKTVRLHLERTLHYAIKKDSAILQPFLDFDLQKMQVEHKNGACDFLDEEDTLYILKASESIKKLDCKMQDLIKSFIPVGSLIKTGVDEFCETYEEPNLSNILGENEKSLCITPLKAGLYSLTQGMPCDVPTILNATYEQWLTSLWEERQILDEDFFLRVLHEEGFYVFQVIRPLKQETR